MLPPIGNALECRLAGNLEMRAMNDEKTHTGCAKVTASLTRRASAQSRPWVSAIAVSNSRRGNLFFSNSVEVPTLSRVC